MGGYIAQTVGFKYGFVLASALSGCAFILSVLFLRETSADALTKSKAKTDKEGNLRNSFGSQPPLYGTAYIVQAAARPITLLAQSPILLLLSFYGAL